MRTISVTREVAWCGCAGPAMIGAVVVTRGLPFRLSSLRARVLWLVGIGVAGTVVSGLVLTSSAFTQRDALGQQRQLTAALTDTGTLLARYSDEETALRGYLLSGGRPLFLQPYTNAEGVIPGLEADLRRQTMASAASGAEAAALLSAHQQWSQAILEPELAQAQTGQLQAAVLSEASGAGKARFDDIRAAGTQLTSTLSSRFAVVSDRAASSGTRLRTDLFLVLTFLLVVLVVLLAGLLRFVIAPLARVGSDLRRVSGGALDHPIEKRGPSEIRNLAVDAEAMRRRLRTEVANVVRGEEALDQHGPAVRALQLALAPNLIAVSGIELATRLEAAEGLLAGDWLDLLPLPGDRLGVVLGDVSGHGPRPAVFALRLKVMISAGLSGGRSPADTLRWTRARVGAEDPEMFATVFIAVLDPRADVLTYASAGHPDAHLLHAVASDTDTTAGASVTNLPATGPLLNALASTWNWGDTTLALLPGDVLVAYTDGLLEARDSRGQQFGTDRLMSALVPATTGAPLDPIVDAAIDAVRSHVAGRLTDDYTMLTCRRLP
jgi:serine phosphatase RsbU (regulator of sigma subunit)/CHASE3 domain sensor protein